MFHTALPQLPMVLSRVYHCCCEYGRICPLTRLSAMYPPLAQPNPAGARLRCPLTLIRRYGAACDTAQRCSPADGVMEKFSAERQKFCVAFPPNQPASTVTSPLIWTWVGFCPRPAIVV